MTTLEVEPFTLQIPETVLWAIVGLLLIHAVLSFVEVALRWKILTLGRGSD